MSTQPVRRDRRHARRDESLGEIVDAAVAVVAAHGAAGLTLGEVARRVGIATPSLYVYFASKSALYDAVFARGWSELFEVLHAQRLRSTAVRHLDSFLLEFASAFVRWSVENPAFAQLMFWRPVPGYQPSEQAYVPAVATLAEARGIVEQLQRDGWLDTTADVDRMLAVWTVLLGGVISQQLANSPGEPFDAGRFTALLPDLVAMFSQQYAQPGPS